MAQVVAHELATYAPQGFLRGRDLHHDVCAVAVFLDHFLETTDLPFDAAETLEVFLL